MKDRCEPALPPHYRAACDRAEPACLLPACLPSAPRPDAGHVRASRIGPAEHPRRLASSRSLRTPLFSLQRPWPRSPGWWRPARSSAARWHWAQAPTAPSRRPSRPQCARAAPRVPHGQTRRPVTKESLAPPLGRPLRRCPDARICASAAIASTHRPMPCASTHARTTAIGFAKWGRAPLSFIARRSTTPKTSAPCPSPPRSRRPTGACPSRPS